MDGIKPKIIPDDALVQGKIQELKRQAQNPAKLKEAAEDFESLFVYYMLKTMRKTVMKSGMLDSGLGGEIMESLFDQKISQKIARGSEFGIAELLLQQLSNNKEESEGELPLISLLPGRMRTPFTRGINTYLRTQLMSKVKPFEVHIEKAARETNVDSDLIRAVIIAESGGDPQAVSSRNARGLMQLLDSTATEVGIDKVLEPEQNILGGARYLAKLLKQFNGDTRLALAAYNAGPSVVKKYQSIPPFPETRNYVKRVLSYYRHFRQLSLQSKL